MSYLVLARKWRPMGFDDLIGQKPIVQVLKNAITQGKIAHAYVFSGPRGVGKTSTARILAKALNCVEGPTAEPCGTCEFCTGITEGISVDVMEIDGASNTGVDSIRDLRERVKYAPSGGRYKVYIIDEAHMLSTAAFNALLKTLEEPPPHVIFVMATTEAKKIPLTVMSRCQHLPFRRVSTQSIRERLKLITDSEGIGISDEALAMIARAADGSIRDSLTILDQLASFSADISEDDVKGLFDTADFRVLADISEAIITGDRPGILEIVDVLVERGFDLRGFTKDLIRFFRDLLVAKFISTRDRVLDVSEEELEFLKKIGAEVTEEHLTLVLSELVKAEADVRFSFSPRVALEMALIKISYLSVFRTVNEAIAAISGGNMDDTEIEAEPGFPKEKEPELKRDSSPARARTNKPSTPPAPAPAAVPDPEPEYSPSPEPDDAPIPEEPGEEVHDDIPDSIEEPSAPAPFTGPTLLEAVVDKLHDPRLSSRLSQAKATLESNTLAITFSSSDAEICAQPFKEKPELVEGPASELMGVPVSIEIHITHASSEGKKPLKQKAMSEPVVKDALDLFEGRVVNVKPIDEE